MKKTTTTFKTHKVLFNGGIILASIDKQKGLAKLLDLSRKFVVYEPDVAVSCDRLYLVDRDDTGYRCKGKSLASVIEMLESRPERDDKPDYNYHQFESEITQKNFYQRCISLFGRDAFMDVLENTSYDVFSDAFIAYLRGSYQIPSARQIFSIYEKIKERRGYNK